MTVQDAPSHFSTSGWDEELAVYQPAATQKEVLTHETLTSSSLALPWFGLVTEAHGATAAAARAPLLKHAKPKMPTRTTNEWSNAPIRTACLPRGVLTSPTA